MLRGFPEIIRTKLKKWDGPNGLVRYYYNDWTRYFEPYELMRYRDEFEVDPTDSKVGIKVFFDSDGCLHVDNCHDPEMKAILKRKMYGWYKNACASTS